MRCGLTGNLCRCTGYTPILEAGRKVDADAASADRRAVSRATRCCSEFAQRRGAADRSAAEWDEQQHVFASPPNLDAALAVLGDASGRHDRRRRDRHRRADQ